jgi:hypothetical protein
MSSEKADFYRTAMNEDELITFLGQVVAIKAQRLVKYILM